MRLHMRLGHFNVQKLKLACELYKTNYKDQIKSTDKLYCCPCSITKARRNALSRNPHRTIKSTADLKQGGDTSVITSKTSPTEGKLASTITNFGYLVFTDILYVNEISFKDDYIYVLSFIDCASRHCILYYLRKRSDICNKLKEYIVWIKILSNVSDVTIAYSGNPQFTRVSKVNYGMLKVKLIPSCRNVIQLYMQPPMVCSCLQVRMTHLYRHCYKQMLMLMQWTTRWQLQIH